MGKWTMCDVDVLGIALGCARGCYQRAVILGEESLSGSTLRGKAAQYGAHYARSRRNLIARLRKAGLQVDETRGARGRRILVIDGGRATMVDELLGLTTAEMVREIALQREARETASLHALLAEVAA
jgi:hypothetical protein